MAFTDVRDVIDVPTGIISSLSAPFDPPTSMSTTCSFSVSVSASLSRLHLALTVLSQHVVNKIYI